MRPTSSILRDIRETEVRLSRLRSMPVNTIRAAEVRQAEARLNGLRQELAAARSGVQQRTVRQTPLVTDVYREEGPKPRPADVRQRPTAVQRKVGGARRAAVKQTVTAVEAADTIEARRRGVPSALAVQGLHAQLADLRALHARQIRGGQLSLAMQTRGRIRDIEKRIAEANTSRGNAAPHKQGKSFFPSPGQGTKHMPPFIVAAEPQVPRLLMGRARVDYIDRRIHFRNGQLAELRKRAIVGGLLSPIPGVGVVAGGMAAADIVNIARVQKIRRQLLLARGQAVSQARMKDTSYAPRPVPTNGDVEALPNVPAPAPVSGREELVEAPRGKAMPVSMASRVSIKSELVKGTDDAPAVPTASDAADATEAPVASAAVAAAPAEGVNTTMLLLGLAAALAAFLLLKRKKKGETAAQTSVRTNRRRAAYMTAIPTAPAPTATDPLHGHAQRRFEIRSREALARAAAVVARGGVPTNLDRRLYGGLTIREALAAGGAK